MSSSSLGGGCCEEPNPRERLLASATEGQPARAPSRDPTRVSGPGRVCSGARDKFDPDGEHDVQAARQFPDGTVWHGFVLTRGVRWADEDWADECEVAKKILTNVTSTNEILTILIRITAISWNTVSCRCNSRQASHLVTKGAEGELPTMCAARAKAATRRESACSFHKASSG